MDDTSTTSGRHWSGGDLSYHDGVVMRVVYKGPRTYWALYGSERVGGVFETLRAAQVALEERAEKGAPQGRLL